MQGGNIMGIKVVDDVTGEVLGVGWDAVAAVQEQQRKTERAEKLIVKAKLSADSKGKLRRRLEGMENEHGKILAQLQATLPDGRAVSFDDDGVPVELVEVQTPEQEAADESKPNKFDELASNV
jgi:hypothetical protein